MHRKHLPPLCIQQLLACVADSFWCSFLLLYWSSFSVPLASCCAAMQALALLTALSRFLRSEASSSFKVPTYISGLVWAGGAACKQKLLVSAHRKQTGLHQASGHCVLQFPVEGSMRNDSKEWSGHTSAARADVKARRPSAACLLAAVLHLNFAG